MSSDADTEVRIHTLEREIGELRKLVLIGNGHPPLIERVATLERALATQTWLLRLVVGCVVTNVIGVLAALAKLYTR